MATNFTAYLWLRNLLPEARTPPGYCRAIFPDSNFSGHVASNKLTITCSRSSVKVADCTGKHSHIHQGTGVLYFLSWGSVKISPGGSMEIAIGSLCANHAWRRPRGLGAVLDEHKQFSIYSSQD